MLLLLHHVSHAAFQFHTFMMGVAPAASSGSACRMERKVSEPSKPRPDRKAPITGITDSSRSSQRTKPCRYCSLNTLRNTQRLITSSQITVQLKLHYSQFRLTIINAIKKKVNFLLRLYDMVVCSLYYDSIPKIKTEKKVTETYLILTPVLR